MVNHTVAEVDPLTTWELLTKILLDFDRIRIFRQTKAARNSGNVRVHDDARWDAVRGSQYNVCRLASNAG